MMKPMKRWRLVILLTILGLILPGANVPSSGEDYLVIKKKDGTTQKVPLKFPPDEIEAFGVEPRAGARPSEGAPSQAEGDDGGKASERELKPAQPPARVMPAPLPVSPKTETGFPSPMVEPSPRTPEERRPSGPRVGEKAPKAETQPGPSRGPTATGPVGKAEGLFNVSVFKLPDNIKELPDFSAFRPLKALTVDKINFQGTKGESAALGLEDKADGIGMRFAGMFRVVGEGIFQWRLHAKDGVRLHIDDKTLIENDGIHAASSKTGFTHLAEGVHTILLDSFNSTGQPVIQLVVTPPVGQEEVFSISRGLKGWQEPEKPYDVLWGQVYFVPKGDYPKGPDLGKLGPIGRIIAPELSVSGGQGFPGLPGRKDMVAIKYEGFFNVSGAGIFAFRLKADHYAKLTIGSHQIAEISGGPQLNPDGKIGWAFFQDGSYPISIEYFHPRGDPKLELYVTEPMKEEVVFAPARPLTGYAADSGKMNMIPAFVYFLKPNTKKIPNYNKMAPAGMFFTKSVDYPINRGTKEFPGIPRKEDWFGIRFYVKFSLGEEEQGTYTFRIVAEDSARLIVGQKLVVNAEGYGKTQDKSGSVTLNAGSHEMFLDYLQGDGPNGVQLFITPPGGEEKIFAFQ
jgi:hypothetical protein